MCSSFTALLLVAIAIMIVKGEAGGVDGGGNNWDGDNNNGNGQVFRGQGVPSVVEGPTTVNRNGLASSAIRDITINKNGVSLTCARRLAGAVYRLTWNGHMVIPELDGNGGSLQVALAFDIPVGESPEIENPTEAGNYKDTFGKTTSRWLEAAASDSEVYTRSQLAYYYPPGDPVASSPSKTRARGIGPVSDVFMKKRVTVGWKFPNVVNFSIDLTWSQDHYFVQVQILAVYLARDFNKAYLAKDGRAVPHNTGNANEIVGISPPNVSYPLIMAKSTDVAVGLYAHTAPRGRFRPQLMPWYAGNTTSAGHKDHGRGLQEVRLSSVTAVWHAGDPTNPSVRIPKAVSFGCALVFGSVSEVAATIQRLSQALG